MFRPWTMLLGIGVLVLAGCDCDGRFGSYSDDDGGVPVQDTGTEGECEGGAAANACGTCSSGCKTLGQDNAFPGSATEDPALQETRSTTVDQEGNLILSSSNVASPYMWISNEYDFDRGTISKVDTAQVKEVARYLTVVCREDSPDSECLDQHGLAIKPRWVQHRPSRTAVDRNLDVWVANRAFYGQASVTKIANDVADCIDRNKNGVIDTSSDQNGDGKITVDCNGDDDADSSATICTGDYAGQAPEFLGLDDECLLFTVNIDGTNAVARSICLAPAEGDEPNDAWVGTNDLEIKDLANRYYKIDGRTGALSQPLDAPLGHAVYGCVVDSEGILWSVAVGNNFGGTVHYFDTKDPTKSGPLLKAPWKLPEDLPSKFYGITIDEEDNIWLGGFDSIRVYRYRPKRGGAFETLADGTWTGVLKPTAIGKTRGITADHRGKIWVAVDHDWASIDSDGYLWRIDQNIADGLHDHRTDTEGYWKLPGAGVIGAGIDGDGHVWGIAKGSDKAIRLRLDADGIPLDADNPSTIELGHSPYSYSDFTGFALQTFIQPEGRYRYRFEACTAPAKATWESLGWTVEMPTGTTVRMRYRVGDDSENMADWSASVTESPASLAAVEKAALLDLEIILSRESGSKVSPTVKETLLSYDCE